MLHRSKRRHGHSRLGCSRRTRLRRRRARGIAAARKGPFRLGHRVRPRSQGTRRSRPATCRSTPPGDHESVASGRALAMRRSSRCKRRSLVGWRATLVPMPRSIDPALSTGPSRSLVHTAQSELPDRRSERTASYLPRPLTRSLASKVPFAPRRFRWPSILRATSGQAIALRASTGTVASASDSSPTGAGEGSIVPFLLGSVPASLRDFTDRTRDPTPARAYSRFPDFRRSSRHVSSIPIVARRRKPAIDPNRANSQNQTRKTKHRSSPIQNTRHRQEDSTRSSARALVRTDPMRGHLLALTFTRSRRAGRLGGPGPSPAPRR